MALARERGVRPAEARDQVDEVVQRIVRKLRRGEAVNLPGVGKLIVRETSKKGRR